MRSMPRARASKAYGQASENSGRSDEAPKLTGGFRNCSGSGNGRSGSPLRPTPGVPPRRHRAGARDQNVIRLHSTLMQDGSNNTPQ